VRAERWLIALAALNLVVLTAELVYSLAASLLGRP